MQKNGNAGVQRRKADSSYRVIWLSGFIMIFPVTLISRLLPSQWKYWTRKNNIMNIVRDSKEQASIMAGIVSKA